MNVLSKSLSCIFAITTCVLPVKSDAVFFEVGFSGKIPEWKMKMGDGKNIIKNGRTVYVSTNIFPDPLDGLYRVDKDGFVHIKKFKAKIKIGGLSELEASARVLKQGQAEDLYAATARFYVRDAAKFQLAQQPGGSNAHPHEPHP